MQELSETRQSQKQDNMVQLTTEQRVFVVTNFIRMQNVREVQDAFRLRFPDRNPPLRNTIVDNVRNIKTRERALIETRESQAGEEQEEVRKNIAAVRELLEENPHVSSRRNPAAATQSTFNRITRLELRWHPYCMYVRHELLDTGWPRRLRFSNWFNQQCENQNFLDRLIIGDEK